MAINVYLCMFKKYNATQLKALEWKYVLLCYGAPFIIAFAYLFVHTEDRGRLYGSAVVCCPRWQEILRRKADPGVSFGVGCPANGIFFG